MKHIDKILIAVIIILTAFITYKVTYTLSYTVVYGLHTYHLSEIDCSTDSMGLLFTCGDKPMLEPLSPTDRLYEGTIYTYWDGDNSVIHRLVKCLDKDCNQSIFKGDNNYVGEIVNRSQITNEVVGVIYR